MATRYTLSCDVIFLAPGTRCVFYSGRKAGIQPAHAKRLRLRLAKPDAARGPLAVWVDRNRLGPSASGMRMPCWPIRRITTKARGSSWFFLMRCANNPPHPGEVLTRMAPSWVLNGKALYQCRYGGASGRGVGGSAESWLYMQASHDPWHAQRTLKRKIAKIALFRHAA